MEMAQTLAENNSSGLFCLSLIEAQHSSPSTPLTPSMKAVPETLQGDRAAGGLGPGLQELLSTECHF